MTTGQQQKLTELRDAWEAAHDTYCTKLWEFTEARNAYDAASTALNGAVAMMLAIEEGIEEAAK